MASSSTRRWCDLSKSHKEMATTIRFGTTSAPCKTASEGRARSAEETDETGNCDPDKLRQCPFDKHHQIRACRFPYHLIKCRKNHPKLASELSTCPFNASHLVPKHELKNHTDNCEDKIHLDSEDDGSTSGYSKLKVPVSTWVNPNPTEDWDAETDDNAAPFVWGINTAPKPRDMRPTNNLGPSFRAPNNFPWSMQI